MELRQVALVAAELEPVRTQVFRLLGIDADFADPGVGEFGLHNSVMVLGDTFLEIVAPTAPGTTAGRLLERRQGDGGYMVLVQVRDAEAYAVSTEKLGIRKVWTINRPEAIAFHVHPKDIGAAIVSFDQMIPDDEWLWAGPDWRERRARHVGPITAVDVQGSDPEALARRWAAAFDRPVALDGDSYVIELDTGVVNVREATDGRGDGVAGVEFETLDAGAVREAADALGLRFDGNEVEVCGTRFRFRNL